MRAAESLGSFPLTNLRPSQRFLLQGLIGAVAVMLYSLVNGMGFNGRTALTFLLVYPAFRYLFAWALGRL